MKIGINGFGRIGRAIYRVNLKNRNYFDIPVINDINPDATNVIYQLNYDTTYGNLEKKFSLVENEASDGEVSFVVENKSVIDEVDWNKYGVEIVVDASGIKDNLLKARDVIQKNESVKKVIVTHSPQEVDFTMVIGANEDKLQKEYQIISSSICDATAIAPVIKLICNRFDVSGLAITTVHPLLSYQNVLDGRSASWFDPSKTYTHYALGRSVFDNIIPKPTTAIDATCKVLGMDPSKISTFSYRTPNTIVASADITLFLNEKTTREEIISTFEDYKAKQQYKIMTLNYDPIVSLDVRGCEYSAVVDARWITVANNRIIKLVLWYDNEWGYSSRVFDQLQLVQEIING